MKRRGFTLIELVIVIAIIIILAGILFPALLSAKRKASQVKCMSHLRQVGLAIQMYANDNDNLAPIGGYDTVAVAQAGQPTQQPPLPAGIRVQWQDILLSTAYLRSADVLICPTAPAADNPYAYRYSYGANHWVMGWSAGANLDAIPYPSYTVLATEKVGYDWPAWPPTERANNPYYFPLDPRHEDQLNVLYCDGHVHKVAIGEFIVSPRVIWHW